MNGAAVNSSGRLTRCITAVHRTARAAAMVRRMLPTYVAYKMGRPMPVAVYLQLTTRCNLTCRHCSLRLLRPTQQLDTDRMLELVDELDRSGVVLLGVAGGEPLLHPGFDRLVRAIRDSRMHAVLSTNGTLLTADNVREIDAAFGAVRLSVDGDEATHDGIRGTGSFQKTLRGLRLLGGLAGRRCRLGVSVTVSESNATRMEATYQRLAPYCDTIGFSPVVMAPGKDSHNEDDTRPEAAARRVYTTAPFVDSLARLARYPKVERPWAPHLPVDISVGRDNCDAGQLYVHVRASGVVTPCPANYTPLGDLNHSSWREVMQRTTRARALEATRSCEGCFLSCTTRLSLLYRQPLWRTLGRAVAATAAFV